MGLCAKLSKLIRLAGFGLAVPELAALGLRRKSTGSQSAARHCRIAQKANLGDVNKSSGVSLGSRAKLEKGGDRPWLGSRALSLSAGVSITETYYYNFRTGDYSYLFPRSNTENHPNYMAKFTPFKRVHRHEAPALPIPE
ncbi:hypothetical protein LZ554_004087 [Drepanopeziza brunnea f. sp. 'monogermtubi']|nr:hypothetical protein LZ554_004087 [Drepanopeziza brunnea f. sp. 'monogermtubi']